VTPVGPRSVNVAFLRDGETKDSFEELLGRFRRCASGSGGRRRIGGAWSRAAAPARSRTVGERLVLIGDAAGYVDAITGQGFPWRSRPRRS